MKKIFKSMVKKLFGMKGQEIVDISDEYIRWLFYANAGMLTKGNLYCFDYVAKHLDSKSPFLEIGSFSGLSTNAIIYYMRKRGRDNRLFTCDKWEFETADPDGMIEASSISHRDYRHFIKESYMRNVRMFSEESLPFTVEMLSDDFFSAWGNDRKVNDVFGRSVSMGGPISFCFIDGNHSYQQSLKDFDNCDKFLEKNGFILFDDSEDDSGWDVCSVVKEVERSGKYDFVMKNPNYLFRKK
ncbi:class I SAM-dependent methyltransferase [Verrucomicrobiota bacterium]